MYFSDAVEVICRFKAYFFLLSWLQIHPQKVGAPQGSPCLQWEGGELARECEGTARLEQNPGNGGRRGGANRKAGLSGLSGTGD